MTVPKIGSVFSSITIDCYNTIKQHWRNTFVYLFVLFCLIPLVQEHVRSYILVIGPLLNPSLFRIAQYQTKKRCINMVINMHMKMQFNIGRSALILRVYRIPPTRSNCRVVCLIMGHLTSWKGLQLNRKHVHWIFDLDDFSGMDPFSQRVHDVKHWPKAAFETSSWDGHCRLGVLRTFDVPSGYSNSKFADKWVI